MYLSTNFVFSELNNNNIQLLLQLKLRLWHWLKLSFNFRLKLQLRHEFRIRLQLHPDNLQILLSLIPRGNKAQWDPPAGFINPDIKCLNAVIFHWFWVRSDDGLKMHLHETKVSCWEVNPYKKLLLLQTFFVYTRGSRCPPFNSFHFRQTYFQTK